MADDVLEHAGLSSAYKWCRVVKRFGPQWHRVEYEYDNAGVDDPVQHAHADNVFYEVVVCKQQ